MMFVLCSLLFQVQWYWHPGNTPPPCVIVCPLDVFLAVPDETKHVASTFCGHHTGMSANPLPSCPYKPTR